MLLSTIDKQNNLDMTAYNFYRMLFFIRYFRSNMTYFTQIRYSIIIKIEHGIPKE